MQSSPSTCQVHVASPRRTLSADLHSTLKDLAATLVECLTHLPNLQTLEIFGTNDTNLVVGSDERNPVQFTSIRELAINNWAAVFIEHCPNVETITLLEEFSPDATKILTSRGRDLKMLKRVVGIAEDSVDSGEPTDGSQCAPCVYRTILRK